MSDFVDFVGSTDALNIDPAQHKAAESRKTTGNDKNLILSINGVATATATSSTVTLNFNHITSKLSITDSRIVKADIAKIVHLAEDCSTDENFQLEEDSSSLKSR